MIDKQKINSIFIIITLVIANGVGILNINKSMLVSSIAAFYILFTIPFVSLAYLYLIRNIIYKKSDIK